MATELDAEMDEVVDPVTADPSLGFGGQRARQFQEDLKYRDRLFAGAAGRVNAAENLVRSLEANRQMNEAKAYSDAAKIISGVATPGGPTESMSFLGGSEEIADQAARTRAAQLKESAESIYGAEDAVSTRIMEDAEVRKGASIFAERKAKLDNFIISLNGLRADVESGIMTGDQRWQAVTALIEMEPDPFLRTQMMLAARGTDASAAYAMVPQTVDEQYNSYDA